MKKSTVLACGGAALMLLCGFVFAYLQLSGLVRWHFANVRQQEYQRSEALRAANAEKSRSEVERQEERIRRGLMTAKQIEFMEAAKARERNLAKVGGRVRKSSENGANKNDPNASKKGILKMNRI